MRPATTRQQAAVELMERIRRGPAWGPVGGTSWTTKQTQQATERYQLWAESWIIPELERLVPELARTKAAALPVSRPDRKTEVVDSWAIAEARCLQLRMAGYVGQAVDNGGRGITIHIAPGKHADLSRLPALASGGA